MKRLRIMKSYAILWLFIYFLIYSNLETITVFFFATLTFNLAVLTILTIGIIMLMRASINVVMLAGTFGTLAYKKDNLKFYLKGIDKIMPANIAHMFNSRAEKGVMLFTTEESRDVIDWIEDKFFHQNRYTNFFIGTALMIGLLGTFTGLLVAIDDMGRIILSLSGDIDLGKVIAEFSGPLGGMAVGFGSSLFGVVAAIILGLKGYILNKNQEILIEGVEDWLKGRIISVTPAAGASFEGGSQLPEGQSSFMDIFVEQISAMTKEMKLINQNSERLHTMTVASIQQARNEHELTIDVMENMHKSLENIDAHSQQTSHMLQEQFERMHQNLHKDQENSIESYTQNIEALFGRLENSLTNSLSTISKEFAQLSEQNEAKTETLTTRIEQTLVNVTKQFENEKALIERLSTENKLSTDTQNEQLGIISQLLQRSLNEISKEHTTLEQLHSQLQHNDDNSASHLKNILASVSRVGETLELEVQQLGNMEDAQRKQIESFEQNTLLLHEMKENLQQSHETEKESIRHLDAIKENLSLVAAEMNQGNVDELQQVASSINSLRTLMQEGQLKQEQMLQEQTNMRSISENGNAILENILSDQKAQMRELIQQQENMLTQQKNLYALYTESQSQENANFVELHQLTQKALDEQNGFRDEHRMLLSLTQRSNELSEEASELTLNASKESLEALEKLVKENRMIKSEIEKLNETIKNKSFGSGGDNDGLFGKLFK